jgi:FixJ family two-component response regulator
MTAPPTVFHVDDDGLVRRELAILLQSVGLPSEGYETVAQFLAACGPERPGCLVVALRLPDQSGLDLLRHCCRQGIHLPAVVLTGHGEVPLAVEAMKLGAVDFLEKPCSDHTLLGSIRNALTLDGQRRQERARQMQTAHRLALLSPGERDVLRLMLAGKGYKTIAAELSISYKTVEARRAKIMHKMSCETLAGLLAFVLSYQYWCGSLPSWERESLFPRPGPAESLLRPWRLG